MANDDLYTPKWIFEELQLKFDLDVCAPKGGIEWIPALKHYSVEDDSLTQPWFGRVWMNPPFSKPRPWVEKFINHANGVALLPLSGNSGWWRELWQSEAKITMIRPNTKFINTDGNSQAIMYGISLWAFGEENINAINNLGKLR